MRTHATAICSSALLLLAVSAAGGEEYLLRFKPTPDSTMRMTQEIEQDIRMEMGAMGSREARSEIRIDSTQKVLPGETAGVTRIDQVMDRITMTSREGDNVLVSFDSTQESDDEAARTLGMLVGKTFTLELSELGEIRAVGGFEQIWNELEAEAEPAARQILQGVKQSLNEEVFRQMLQAALPAFPAEPVAIGQSWDHSADLRNPMFGTMKTATTFTAEGEDQSGGERCLRLGVAIDLELDFDSELLNQLAAASGGEMKVEVGDVTSTGTMCVALTDGVTVESRIHQDLEMKMDIALPNQPAMQMTMAMSQLVHQTVER